MEDIARNLETIRGTLPDDVTLVAVTKTHTYQEINEAVDAGVTDIGENKVQEILEKYDYVKSVRWHMIGHLQTNKVRQIIDKVYMIQSVDSLKLAREINKRAQQHQLTMNILVQVSPANEKSKFGIPMEKTEKLVKEILETCPNVKICGLMCVAPFADDPKDVKIYFDKVKQQYDKLAQSRHKNLEFRHLSMGMSHDYMEAMKSGANMVRIGSAIFGKRVY